MCLKWHCAHGDGGGWVQNQPNEPRTCRICFGNTKTERYISHVNTPLSQRKAQNPHLSFVSQFSKACPSTSEVFFLTTRNERNAVETLCSLSGYRHKTQQGYGPDLYRGQWRCGEPGICRINTTHMCRQTHDHNTLSQHYDQRDMTWSTNGHTMRANRQCKPRLKHTNTWPTSINSIPQASLRLGYIAS